jgi:hypothetical protein
MLGGQESVPTVRVLAWTAPELASGGQSPHSHHVLRPAALTDLLADAELAALVEAAGRGSELSARDLGP